MPNKSEPKLHNQNKKDIKLTAHKLNYNIYHNKYYLLHSISYIREFKIILLV